MSTKKTNYSITFNEWVKHIDKSDHKSDALLNLVVETTGLPQEDIETAIEEGLARNWVFEKEFDSDCTMDYITEQTSHYFIMLINMYVIKTYEAEIVLMHERKAQLVKKLNRLKDMQADDVVWQKCPKDEREMIKRQIESYEEEVYRLDETIANIILNKKEDTRKQDQEVLEEASLEEERATEEKEHRELRDDKHPLDSKEDEKIAMTLNVFKEINQRLQDLLVKVDSLLQHVEEMISEKKQLFADQETHALEDALQKSGANTQKIEIINEQSNKVIEVKSKELIDQEVEKDDLQAGEEREMLERKLQEEEAKATQENRRDKAESMDRELIDIDDIEFDLDDLDEVNEVPDETIKSKAQPKQRPKKP